MSIVGDIIARRRERARKVKAYEEDESIVRNSAERKLSHNERELVKALEEERQETIKEALKHERRKRKAEDKLKSREFMTFHSDWFTNDSILSEKDNFLKGGNW